MSAKTKPGVKKVATESPKVEASCGNIFADLGIANPEIALEKAKLVLKLEDLISDRKLTPSKAAMLLGLPTEKLKMLRRGQTQRFTLDRLFKLLYALGQDVEIVVRPAAK